MTTFTAHPLPLQQASPPLRPVADLDIVVPVYNERKDLANSVARLHDFVASQLPYSAIITIADNASTDGTWDIARALERQLPAVRATRVEAKGRGRALKQVWLASTARVVVYMDVDLSTDLAALAPLVAPLLSGHSDIAIGTRLSHSSRVERGAKREIISRSYNLLLRLGLAARFSDAQCGFKAMTSCAARELLPWIADTGWFFDTELLVLAERAGLRVFEVPVDWVDDPNSSVDIVDTARKDLAGMRRVRRELADGTVPIAELRQRIGRMPAAAGGLIGQILRFGAVGVLSTLCYVLVYFLARGGLGPQWANVVALGISAVANTAMNRRVTFGIRGSRSWWRHQAQGLVVFLLALTITSGSLALLTTFAPRAGVIVETVVLCVANLVATVLRFSLLRSWVFAPTAAHLTEKDAT